MCNYDVTIVSNYEVLYPLCIIREGSMSLLLEEKKGPVQFCEEESSSELHYEKQMEHLANMTYHVQYLLHYKKKKVRSPTWDLF